MPDDKDKLIAKPLAMRDEEDDEPAGPQTPGGERKNYFIGIGIGQYQSTKINDLSPYCENDCTDLMKLLMDEYSFESVKGVYKKNGKNVEKINDNEQVLFNEAATVNNIRALFDQLPDHPDFTLTAANAPEHNLLIFYSGHGEIIKDREGVDTFYWVPSDYENDGDARRLFDVFKFLEDLRKYTRFHSLVLVTDACHSAGTFDLAGRVITQRNIKPGARAEEYRSAWALCSSADDQESFATEGDRNSEFTKHILYELQKSQEIKLRISTLCDRLDDGFDGTLMHPFTGRLDLVASNTGVFCFNGNEKKQQKIEAKERGNRLKKDFMFLNYNMQAAHLSGDQAYNGALNNPNVNRYLMFFCAEEKYGLMMARRLLCGSSYFPVKQTFKSEEPGRVSQADKPPQEHCYLNELPGFKENMDINTVVKIVCNVINLEKEQTDKESSRGAVKLPVENEEDFRNQIVKRLRIGPVFAEFRIMSGLPDDKALKAFLKNLHDLLAGLEFEEEPLHRFCILILDQNKSDYNAMIKEFQKSEVVTYVMPSITGLKLTELDFWYLRAGMDDQESYNKLFKDKFDTVKTTALDEGEYPPGLFIKTFCNESGCCELALELLNFNPPDYDSKHSLL